MYLDAILLVLLSDFKLMTSCDCSHIPLHCPRNKGKIKSKKKKRKSK